MQLFCLNAKSAATKETGAIHKPPAKRLNFEQTPKSSPTVTVSFMIYGIPFLIHWVLFLLQVSVKCKKKFIPTPRQAMAKALGRRKGSVDQSGQPVFRQNSGKN